ncbi:MAG: GNAT family N-acetyltransferase [Candidatus Puniceispirillaceae bacterium]
MEQRSSYHFEKVEAGHFDDLCLLRHKLWPQDTQQEHLAEISALYNEMPYCAFVCYDGKVPVAFAEVSLRHYVNGCLYRPVAFLEGIFVDPAYQRQSLGLQLVELCEAWAREKDVQELGADAYLENLSSQQAHKSWGFQMTEKVVYFRKKL